MLLDGIATDVRLAVRRLARPPSFTLAVVAVTALGIGANAAVFTALDQTVIRPLPFREPDRLVMLWEDLSREHSSDDGRLQNDVSKTVGD